MAELQQCTRCVFDSEHIPSISFDEKGVCNYCKQYDQLVKNYPIGEQGEEKLFELAKQIKASGKGKKYDCVIGVSGGCDSSYLLYLFKEKLGLRPLGVHFDNTWNSKKAVENIHNVLKALDIDLYTHVVDNEEFSNLARSMLEASVPEIDALTDVGLITTLYQAADKFGVKYIMDGHNFRTEGVGPVDLFYFDAKYIDTIHKTFGNGKIQTYPSLWIGKWLGWLSKGIKRARPLYYVDLNKEEIKKFLSEKFGWQWYGGHHQENRYTFFENRYYLPKKFNIDLRYVEYAALVRTGALKREKALEMFKEPIDFPLDILEEIKKRLQLSDKDFDRIMNAPVKSAKDYKTYRELFKKLRPLFWVLYKMGSVPESFYLKYTK